MGEGRDLEGGWMDGWVGVEGDSEKAHSPNAIASNNASASCFLRCACILSKNVCWACTGGSTKSSTNRRRLPLINGIGSTCGCYEREHKVGTG